MSFDVLFANALRRPATCLLVNNRLSTKLFLSAPVMSNDNLRVTIVTFLVIYLDGNLIT